MKPFWREPYRDQFLERAGLYLLYAFILSIAANPFIMLAVGLDKFCYVQIESQYEGLRPVLTPEQQEVVDKCRVVDDAFVERQEEFGTLVGWIIITALLGWCATSPRFQRGWPKIMAKLKETGEAKL